MFDPGTHRDGDETLDVINVNNLTYVYPDGTEVRFGAETKFTVKQGEKVVLIGANGSGKSTLLSVIMGLYRPTEGQVTVLNQSPTRDFKQVRKKIGVVFQNVDEQIIGPRVFDDIAFTLRQNGMAKEAIEARVKEVTSLLKLEDKLDKIPHYLSGGEKQKVALAGAIVHHPEILILDEPLDSLDMKSRNEVEGLLNRLNADMGITVVLTTHEVNWVPRFADTVYLLAGGKIISSGSPKEVLADESKLWASDLEPPVLVSFFQRLQRHGLNLETPVDLREAEKLMARYLMEVENKKGPERKL